MEVLTSFRLLVASLPIPRFDGNTLFSEAYSRLNRAGNGAFLIIEAGNIKAFVNAIALAQKAVEAALGLQPANEAPDLEAIAEWLRQRSKDELEAITGRVRRMSDAPLTVILAEHNEIDVVIHFDAEAVPPEDEAKIKTASKQIPNAVMQKAVFICPNGHKNPDPDHGTCYNCPGPIVKVEQV